MRKMLRIPRLYLGVWCSFSLRRCFPYRASPPPPSPSPKQALQWPNQPQHRLRWLYTLLPRVRFLRCPPRLVFAIDNYFGSNYSTSRYKEVTNSTCSSAIRLSDTIWTRRSSQSFWLLATTTFLISSSFDNVSTCSRASSSLARPEASLFAEECSAPLFSASKAR